MRRVVVAVVVLALVAMGGGGLGIVYLTRRAFPQTSGTIAVAGLQRPVEVIRDGWGVPHIFARSARDLFFAQGFVHAQDRLWQMELNRRTASGRLSEVFGEATLATDRFLRTIGLRRAAETHLATLSRRARDMLEAYAAGVNASIAASRGRLPIEFLILGFAPEPWTPADTLAYGKLMAWVLGGDWRSEILRQQLVERFGDGALERLMPDYPASPVIVPGARADTARTVAATSGLSEPGPATLAPPDGSTLPGWSAIAGAIGALPGSNNWVVAGDRTATTRPLLANDPHLEAQMPAVWYLMHLTGGPYDVAGATFPGVPGVIIGHNRDIAWGVTNANPDVQDLYIERFHPQDPNRYLFKGEWLQATVIRETIRVKGRTDPVVEPVRITRHGPILNNVVRGLGQFLALRWTALDSSAIIDAVDGINRASSWDEFREALRAWDTPAQNFVFAHRNGEIGYQLPGRIPVRARGGGALPAPGWTGEYEWTGTLPFDVLPSVHRSTGVVVTANNRIAPPGYAHVLGRDWDPGFRALRIGEMLASGSQTVETTERIQTDVTSIPGRAVVAVLRSETIADPSLRSLFKELAAWDGVLSPASRSAALYEAFVDALIRELFKGPLDDATFARYVRHYQAPTVAMLALLRDPASGWWRGERSRLIERAFREAVQTLERRLGPDRRRWRWGRLHQPVFVHPLGRVKAFAWIFNTTPPETGGDAFTVNQGAFNPEEPFGQVIVASYRQILDPSNWDRSRVIHTTGQSGLPFHPHYRDFAARWARGEYVPLLFSRRAIEQAAEATLVLEPR
jgi:penicillin amidase